MFYLYHKSFENNNSTGNISNLPANISKLNTIFEISDKKAKFPVGPVKFRPGPILLIHVVTVPKAVEKSNPCNDIINKETINTIAYNTK